MQHNEKELFVLPCPIMDIDNSVHYTIGLEVMKTAILKSFEGNPLSISKLRDKYVTLWDAYWTENHGVPAESPTGPYWSGPRHSILIANKIITFLNEYEITSPIQPFSYTLETMVLDGSSCVVRKKITGNKPRSYLTVIFQEEVTEESTKPDIVALVKWYNVESLYGSTIPNGLLYVPIIKGKSKPVSIANIKLAKTWILNAFKAIKTDYPVAGPHCKQCKSKKCEEVLNVGQNEDRRIKWIREISTHR